MDVTCSHCNTEYEFDDALVSDAGTSVRCTQCGHRFKVRRREGSAAPEVWIVRTVEGHTLEFRALRELKVAIGNKKVGRDDVLSRGSGRPRRLASIAELEPFFSQPGDAKARNPREAPGSPRGRALTPSGLGPADPRGSHFDLAAFVPKRDGPTSVNVPPPTPSISSRETNPFLDEDEVTRSRQFTRELRQFGDGPPSVEPKTEPEPARFRDQDGPRTMLGVPQLAPPAPPSDLATTKAFGTPVEARSVPSVVNEPENDRRQPTLIGLEAAAQAALTELAESRPTEPAQAALMAALIVESQAEPPTKPRRPAEPTPNPSPVYAGAAAPAAPKPAPAKAPLPTPKPPPAAKLPPPPAAKLPPPPAASEPPAVKVATPVPSAPAPAPKAATPAPKAAAPAPKAPSKPAPPPAPAAEPVNEAVAEPPASAGRPNVLPPAPVGVTAVKLQDEPPVIQEAPRSVGPRGGRASAFTPTPASEIRYSLADDPDARPTSASGSRRAASSSMRLIVALLIGGSLIFVGILLVNRFVRRGNVEAGSQNGNVEELLAAYEKALAAGDLSSASEKANEARKLADSEPRVAKAVAKVAVAKAELAWLELLLLPSADAGRSVVHRRYQTEIEEAQKATERAALLAPNDVEVARSVLDTKRILGDLAAAQRLRSSVDSVASDPETQLSLGALELLGELPPGALGKLERATAGEKQAGRARSIYIYALARANDAKRARVELDELAKLAKPHPLEAALRRFVERVEKGEKIAFRSGDVPTPKSAEASSVDVSAPLKAAEDALARRDSKKAEALFQQVLAADAENADALVGLAQIAKQTGNTKQAVAFLERAVAKHPEHAKALLALADAKWDGGEANLARPLYQRALDGGLTGAGVERAKTRATAAAVATGGTVPPDVPTAPTTTATTTSEPLPTSPTSTTPPPFGQDPPPFGQDPPPPPKDPPPPPPPAPTNTVPGAPL